MGQEFLSTLTKERSFSEKQVLVKHHLGHLPAKVLNRIVYNAELRILLNKWVKLGLIVENSTKICEGKIVCMPSVKKDYSFRVNSDLRNCNCPLQ